jgi:hypothetical protein
MAMDVYGRVRTERRKRISELKRNRRLSVGPDVTFYFENYETMLHQVHEMLFVEKGGEEQIEGELQAYNPLIPDGSNLVATMMIGIDDPQRRARVLRNLTGIETTLSLTFQGEVVTAVAESDTERTTVDGKTSSVHFVKFPFSPAQADLFSQPGMRVVLGIGHPHYDHMAALPEPVRAALAQDFG